MIICLYWAQYAYYANIFSLTNKALEKTDNRLVAIIKIWNLETDKRKAPKLFFWNYFWKLFRKPKLYFQKKDYFHGIGLSVNVVNVCKIQYFFC